MYTLVISMAILGEGVLLKLAWLSSNNLDMNNNVSESAKKALEV
jgi:hypothetical protein